jgi:mRNA interferase MazF
VVIRQGDLYWLYIEKPVGSEPGYRHPCVVIQNDVFNASRISTTIVCTLTSNLKRAQAPGNVLLAAGEGNLPRQSVVVVSQVLAVNKMQLVEYIGALPGYRIREIVEGLYLLTEPWEID